MGVSDERSRIRAYIEQNQTTYSPHALRQKLLEAGYDQTLVDQALAELDEEQAQQRASSGLNRPTAFYLGMVLLGPLNFVLYGLLVNSALSSTTAALVSVGAVVALSGLIFLLGRRSFAGGLLSGYALLTLLSGGTCTLGAGSSIDNYGLLLSSLILYPVALAVLGIVLAVRSGAQR